MFGFDNYSDFRAWLTDGYPWLDGVLLLVILFWLANNVVRPMRREHQKFWETTETEDWHSKITQERREKLHLRILMDIREMLALIGCVIVAVGTVLLFECLFGNG